MTRPAHVLMLGVLFGLFSQTAIAAQLEQTGKPEQKITVTKTYGVGVATAKALRTLVPEGWRTFIQPSVQLPESLSWDVGQEWTSVLARLADSEKIAVHVDWTEKSVFIRTPGSTAVIGHVTADAATDAVTPLPRFAPVSLAAAPVLPAKKAEPLVLQGIAPGQAPAVAAVSPAPSTIAVESPRVAAPIAPGTSPDALVAELTKIKRELAESNAARVEAEAKAENHRDALLSSVPELLPPAPVLVPAAEPQRVETAAEMAVALLAAAPRESQIAPTAPTGTADFAYTAPVGLNRPNARSVAQGIANKFHLRLVWAAPEYSLSGPVTLLGNAADEDMQLLGKAMGLFSPIYLEIPTGQGILLAVSKTGTYPDLAAAQQPKPALANTGPVAAALPDSTNRTVASITVPTIPTVSITAPAPATVAVAPTPAAPVVPARVSAVDELATGYVLVVNAGEPLELAIPRFARENGYSVEWKVSGGFEAKRSMTFAGESIKDVLLQVLPKLGVSADINKREAHIVVRPVDPARDF